MIQYHVSFANPLTFYLQIQLTLDVPADVTEPVALQLPAWRPGRYELQNFAQKIQKVVIIDAASGESLPPARRPRTAGKWPARPAGSSRSAITSTPTRWTPAAPGSMSRSCI